MPRPELIIIVCIDSRECRYLEFQGRTGEELLHELGALVIDEGLEELVQVTPCRCILGCTYGPRIDVARRWSGEKLLYGAGAGETNISIRGRVKFQQIPGELRDLIADNLPSGLTTADSP